MKQETGETRDAIMETVDKRIDKIINFHKDYKDPYWIVLFATPSKQSVEGKHTLRQHIKAYFTRPPSSVGMCIAEVNNATGELRWEINMPQKPFDMDRLLELGAKPGEEVVLETTSIPGAYLTK